MLDTLQFGPSIALALALQPDLEHVYVVVGTTGLDPSEREPGEGKIFRPFEGRVEFTYLSGLVAKISKRDSARCPRTRLCTTWS